ncbi:MAG TPA: hypothetical protein VIW69_06905 [Candidatus Elarobacter sp.]
MTSQSRHTAGILLIVFPTVIYGGSSLLRLLIEPGSRYLENPLRESLWRAGHAHAAVLLVLSLVILQYVDDARLPARAKAFVRVATPAAAILLPTAYFCSVLSPAATAPSPIIGLAYVGAVVMAAGLLVLGIGLVRRAS